jgi:hypothetical protein
LNSKRKEPYSISKNFPVISSLNLVFDGWLKKKRGVKNLFSSNRSSIFPLKVDFKKNQPSRPVWSGLYCLACIALPAFTYGVWSSEFRYILLEQPPPPNEPSQMKSLLNQMLEDSSCDDEDNFLSASGEIICTLRSLDTLKHGGSYGAEFFRRWFVDTQFIILIFC